MTEIEKIREHVKKAEYWAEMSDYKYGSEAIVELILAVDKITSALEKLAAKHE